jgi:tRNA threonylcarbamoyladenosine biosynthesis protein TsaB
VPAILIFETSTDTASLALAVDGRLVIERSFTSDRRHNALLFSPLAEIVEEFGSRHFDAILVGSGPGSYSGTRVGIAAAQGAGLVSGCKAIAIPSILGTETALSRKPCIAVGDARRGSYWVAQINGNELIEGPTLTDAIGFQAALDANPSCFSMEQIRSFPVPLEHPTARGIWQTWENASPQTRALWTAKPPQPIYLAPPHITPSKKQEFGNSVIR